jgi:hypothetical protein
MELYGMTKKEVIQLRLKCLEPFIVIAAKTSIEQDVVIKKAEVAWKYAIKPLEKDQPELPEKPLTDGT